MRKRSIGTAMVFTLSTSILMAPVAQASGFIFVDPAFHATIAPPVTPVTPTISRTTPLHRPTTPLTPRPVNLLLRGRVSTGLHLEHQDIQVQINDQVAKTYIKQTFKNNTDRNLAGTYLFPLPQDATFSSFSLHIDGKPVEGQIMAAAEARSQYETIVRKMVDPGLLEYADYKTVRARIFPIPAHGEKTVELEYTQLIKADSGMYKYRFPLKSAGMDAVNETKINVALNTQQRLRTIWSPTHIVSSDRSGDNKAKVQFSNKGETEEKDFLLYYTVSDSEMAANLLTHKKMDENGYFLLTLSPPLKAKTVVAKDIVLVADTSGSMRGEKMEQAKKALKYFVESLNSEDRFSLVSFNTDAEAFTSNLLPATSENKKKAVDFIAELESRGGTNIGEALSIGSDILNAGDAGKRPAFLVLMTDGEPTVGKTAQEELLKTVNGKRDIRLFDFGVGYDVNTQLLNKLAEDHHGTAKYIEPDENLEIALSNFYTKIKSPVLSNVKISYEGVEAKEIYPKETKDIFAGTQVALLGRYKAGAQATVKLTGEVNGVPKAYSFPLAFADRDAGQAYLPRLWAMRRIGYLTEVAQANDDAKEVVDEIVELSKRYGIISAYTSFLATDPNENVRPALAGVPGGLRDQPRMINNARGFRRSFFNSNALNGGAFANSTPAFFSFNSRQRGAMGLVPPPPVVPGGGAVSAMGSSGDLRSAVYGRTKGGLVAVSKAEAGAKEVQKKKVALILDDGSDKDSEKNAQEERKAFAHAIRTASVSGKQAVAIQQNLSDLRTGGAISRADEAGLVQVIDDKTFYFVNGFWVDSSFEKVREPKLNEVKFGSKEYFALVRDKKDLIQYLGAGDQVIVVHNGTCYKIVADSASG